jgi:hypothetical protein
MYPNPRLYQSPQSKQPLHSGWTVRFQIRDTATVEERVCSKNARMYVHKCTCVNAQKRASVHVEKGGA